MNIDQLDEYQGIEAQMVQEWLRNQGFDMRLGGLLHAGTYLVRWEPIASSGQTTEASLCAVARYRDQSVQTLLREINPRMRKGMPSDAAINAHADRHWVAKSSQRGGVTRIIEIAMGRVVMVQTLSETQRIDLNHLPDGWHYWPCDEHGNKVRWPEKDGVML